MTTILIKTYLLKFLCKRQKHLILQIELYIKVKDRFFELSRSTTSYENVENVVKDPNKPITKKYLINSNDMFFIYPIDIKYPIKNEPIMFMESVE